MPSAYVAVMPLLAAVFILIAGNGIVSTLVPLRATMEGFSQAEIGLIGSGYFLGMLAGTWRTPSIVRRAGHIQGVRGLCGHCGGRGAGLRGVRVALGLGGVPRHLRLLLCRALCHRRGLGVGKGQQRNRGRMLAMYNVVHFAGSATGPADAALRRSALVHAVLGRRVVPGALARADGDDAGGTAAVPPKGRLEIFSMFRASPIAAVGIAMVGWANGAFWSLVPPISSGWNLDRRGRELHDRVILGSATGPYPLGRMSDLMDRRWVIAGTAGAAALTEFALVLLGAAGALAALRVRLPARAHHPRDLFPDHRPRRRPHGTEKAIAISSTLLFLYCCGGIVGPMVASTLMEKFGQNMLFVHNGVVHTLMTAFVVWRIVRRAPAVRVDMPEETAKKPPGSLT